LAAGLLALAAKAPPHLTRITHRTRTSRHLEEKILEEKTSYGVLFFRQEKSFQDHSDGYHIGRHQTPHK
jgi:hypothetical protein